LLLGPPPLLILRIFRRGFRFSCQTPSYRPLSFEFGSSPHCFGFFLIRFVNFFFPHILGEFKFLLFFFFDSLRASVSDEPPPFRNTFFFLLFFSPIFFLCLYAKFHSLKGSCPPGFDLLFCRPTGLHSLYPAELPAPTDSVVSCFDPKLLAKTGVPPIASLFVGVIRTLAPPSPFTNQTRSA